MDASARVKRKSTCENKAVEYHPRQTIGVEETLSLENDLTIFFQCPKKKRNPRLRAKSAHVPTLFNRNPGSFLLVKHQEPSGKSGTFSFSQELVEEILSRLPVKSLARFSCVSKLWYDLIYSERFASLHISNYKTSQLLVGTCAILLDPAVCSLSFLPTPLLDGVYCDSDRVASQKVLNLSPSYFGGSVNGIVCLYAHYTNDIRLWNPVTKHVRVIPKSNIPRVLGPVVRVVGFGFDPKTNDYKILQMLYGKAEVEIVIQLELYSLRKNSWRKVDYAYDFYFKNTSLNNDKVCSLPQGICGMVRTRNRPTMYEIFLFDVSSEAFDTISIPQSVEADFLYSRVKVVPFRESFALGISHEGVQRGKQFIIWVVNDLYSSESCSRSWSKLVSVEHNLDIVPRVIGIWKNRILYQIETNRHGSIGLIDVDNSENTELVSWLGGQVNASIYKESIVGVWEKREGKRLSKKLQKKSKTIQPQSI